MLANYFFIDGSALMAQIRQLQRAEPAYRNRKLCVRKFISYQITALQALHNRSYKRATFYFANGDDYNINEYLLLPDHSIPGSKRDIHFKYCGHKLKKSAEFDKFVEEKVPPKFQSRFSKSEKGIDIEMCCDALRLASASRLERLFILTNDSDFIPLCRTIKEFGANISIIHLSRSNPPNEELLREADTYDVVLSDGLDDMFHALPLEAEGLVEIGTLPIEAEIELSIEQRPQSEKPDTAPSDLITVAGLSPEKDDEPL
ncbi:NYN domain-containing protein (plasmid) [Komagataeibacter oboediens]|uniref:NYN domain-containing protein n=1 Tax=Komagataeibacter oboediens TaxID=65958 RepID=UPI0023DC031C|nr:NYN domain-containing protein [Komagataeibacter oboediens]WEQ54143.1 NYN domain-containing protein [Komagataeibacter oboediens]